MPNWLKWLLYALTLGVGALTGLVAFDRVVMPLFVRQGTIREVPDVTNVSEADAQRSLDRSGFKSAKYREEYSATIPKGNVIRQTPPAGAKAKRGRTVRLIVSQGGEMVPIPDVRNQSVRSAQAELQSSRLVVGDVEYVPAPGMPRDQVLNTDPPPGTVVPQMSRVNLRASQGSSGESYVRVPQLVGKSIEDAKISISQSSLSVGTISMTSAQKVPSGTVLKQELNVNALVPPGTAVNLVVSQ